MPAVPNPPLMPFGRPCPSFRIVSFSGKGSPSPPRIRRHKIPKYGEVLNNRAGINHGVAFLSECCPFVEISLHQFC